MTPLVSCILVTRDRPAFVRQAIRCFSAQDYPSRELIVVDDGEAPVESVCEGVDHVTYLRVASPMPTGAKLNLGARAARGQILQKMDDDDYYGPAFLTKAVDAIERAPDPRTLVAWCCFTVLISGDATLYSSGHGWHTGGTLCFRRDLWSEHGFREIYAGSDSCFIRDHLPVIVKVCAADQYIVVRHGHNTWRRVKGADLDETVEDYFRRRPIRTGVRELVGPADAGFYESLMHAQGAAPWTQTA